MNGRRGRPRPPESLERLVSTGRFAEALHAWMDRPVPDHTPQARLFAATAAARVGAFQTGQDLADAALRQFNLVADDRGRMRAYNVLGGIAFERGRLGVAEQCFRQSVALGQLLDDRVATARGWNNLGSVEHMRGKPASALRLYASAAHVYDQLDDAAGSAQTHHNLGLVHRELGEHETAEEHVAEAVQQATRSNDPPLLALTLTGRAELALARSDLAAATTDLEDALQTAEDAGDSVGSAEARRLLAEVAFVDDRPEEALRTAEVASRRAAAVDAGVLHAECAALIARILRLLGREQEAEKRHLQAVSRLQELGAPHVLQRVLDAWTADPSTNS